MALDGCGDKCAGMYCAPCNAFTGDIVVAFDRDSIRGGFRKAEIDGGYVVLYVAPGFASPVDTVRQIRGGVDFYRGYSSLRTLPWSVGPTPARGRIRRVTTSASCCLGLTGHTKSATSKSKRGKQRR